MTYVSVTDRANNLRELIDLLSDAIAKYPYGYYSEYDRGQGSGQNYGHHFYSRDLTVGDTAALFVAAGVLDARAYDTALPQQWVDAVYRATGEYPYGCVWDYSPRDASGELDASGRGSIFGRPFALTSAAQRTITAYASCEGRMVAP